MANYRLISNPVIHIDDDNGVPLAGGTLKAYDSGTSTPKAFYLDVNGTSSATETTLDARGEAVIYGTGTYKLEIYDADDVLVITIDPYTIMPVSNWAQDFLTKTTAAAARTKLGIGSAYTLDAGGNAGDLVQLDTAGKIPAYDGSQITNLTDTQVYNLPRGWISGLEINNSSGSTTFTISDGEARDSTNTCGITISSNLTKTISSIWAAGENNGCLDTGSIAANTWYHVFVIKIDSSGAGDVLISTSPTRPTMPTGSTYFRRIGSMCTDGSSNLIPTIQNGDCFKYVTPLIAINSNGSKNITSTASTYTLQNNGVYRVPNGIEVDAIIRYVFCQLAVGASITIYPIGVTDPTGEPEFLIKTNTETTSITTATLPTNYTDSYQSSQYVAGEMSIHTNTSAQFKAVAFIVVGATTPSTPDADGYFNVVAIGWIDTRGKDD